MPERALGDVDCRTDERAEERSDRDEGEPAQRRATAPSLGAIAVFRSRWRRSANHPPIRVATTVRPASGTAIQVMRLRGKLMALTGLGAGSPIEDVVVAAHERLAAAPSALVAGTLEDALAQRLRPNLPGTTDERPNWSLTLPVPLAEVFADPLVARVTNALHRG